jgi:uncharacterized protein YabE (DUF348 family)
MLLRYVICAGVMLFTVAAAKETKRVEVDGSRYRVTTQNGTVIVANKGMVVAYSVEERDRQRAAVLAATGCRVVDELPGTDARLRGKLDCAGKR